MGSCGSRDLTLGELRRAVAAAALEDYPVWMLRLEADQRLGALRLGARLRERWLQALDVQAADRARWRREGAIRSCHGGMLAGIDEVGRGPLAGPVVAGAVILPPGCYIRGLDDSKRLSARKRRLLLRRIRRMALDVSLGVVGPAVIDRIGIQPASLLAMRRAVDRLGLAPAALLVDGQYRISGLDLPQVVMVGADHLLPSVSAASVVAKVYRDSLMMRYALRWPAYGFDSNRGYGTAGHLEALGQFGPSPLHRRSFLPSGPAMPGSGHPRPQM